MRKDGTTPQLAHYCVPMLFFLNISTYDLIFFKENPKNHDFQYPHFTDVKTYAHRG